MHLNQCHVAPHRQAKALDRLVLSPKASSKDSEADETQEAPVLAVRIRWVTPCHGALGVQVVGFLVTDLAKDAQTAIGNCTDDAFATRR